MNLPDTIGGELVPITFAELVRDFSLLEDGLSRAEKDRRRIMLFVTAVQVRAVELAQGGEVGAMERFALAAGALIGEWARVTGKLSLRDLFRDPYRDLRGQTREFAVEWNLDPEFRRAMGIPE